MTVVGAVARKEVRDALNSSWLLLYAGMFTLLALGLSYLGERNLGSLGFENFSRTTASLLNLCLLLAPLVALALGSGAISGERDRGTLTYLLAQPLDRWELLIGKYIGLTASIALATTAGFGIAGLVIAVYTSSLEAGTYALFLALVLGLIAVMTGLGLVVSVMASSRVQALGLAMMIWFVAAFFFDLVLIGMVSTTSLGGGGLLLALLLNPIEIVRVLGIMHLEPDLQILGPFGSYLMERVGIGGATVILVAVLTAWIALPLALAAWIFESREM
jgi:Cu-processing system permease protein